ncbi:MAG TPA: hypothetical protein VGU01_14865 [Sphingomicrobium sp.]|nr:hypothetical protein [Sphingomicrobium sp.]
MRTLLEDHGAAAIGGYIRRARQERELAAVAITAEGAFAHLKLAHHYEGLVAQLQNLERGQIAADQDGTRFDLGSGVQSAFPFGKANSVARLISSRSHH